MTIDRLTLLQNKAAEVGKAANTKVAAFSGEELSLSLTQFRNRYPNASADVEGAFLNQQREHINYPRNTSMLGDIGTDLGISFGDNFPKMVGALGGIAAERLGLDKVSDGMWDYVAQQQAESLESEKDYSYTLLASKQKILDAATARKAEYMSDGEITMGETVKDFFSTGADYLSNPTSLVSEAAQSADSIVTVVASGGIVGGVAKVAASQAIKAQLGKEALKRAGAARIANVAAKKAAQRAGVAATAVTEGSSNAIQTRDEIMAIPQDILEASEDFQTLRKENPDLDFKAAQKKFANEGAFDTAVISGAIAAGVGKLSGASDAASTSLVKGATKDGIAKTAAKGAGKEMVEELVQSGSGQLVGNIQVAEGDESKQVLEDVGSSAAAGMLSGGLLGGSMAGAGRTVTKAAETAQTIKTGLATRKAAKEAAALEAATPFAAPPEATPTVKANNPVEQYAEQNAPTPEVRQKEASAGVVRANQLATKYTEHVTENEAVRAVLTGSSALATLSGESLAGTSLNDNSKGAQELFTEIETLAVAANAQSTQAMALLEQEGDTLSPADKEVLEEIAVGGSVEYAPDNSVLRAFMKAESGELTEQITKSIETFEAQGMESKDAGRQAFLNSIGNVVLYSREAGKKVPPELLFKLAEHVSDPSAKALLNFTAELRSFATSNTAGASKGIAKVADEIFVGGGAKASVGAFAERLLDEVASGNVAKVAKAYDSTYGYLARVHNNKLTALKEALHAWTPESAHKPISWDTSGEYTKVGEPTSNNFKPYNQKVLENLVKVMTTEQTTLQKLATLADSVVGGKGVVEPIKTEAPSQVSTKVELTGSGRQGTKNLAKDQAKSDMATKFIGYGKAGSSTAQYAEAWGENANTGKYTSDDVVFLSSNGGVGPTKVNSLAMKAEIDKAIEAGATLVTDKATTRNTSYNINGEGQVATYLTAKGYVETDGDGVWSSGKVAPKAEPVNETVVEVVTPQTEDEVSTFTAQHPIPNDIDEGNQPPATALLQRAIKEGMFSAAKWVDAKWVKTVAEAKPWVAAVHALKDGKTKLFVSSSEKARKRQVQLDYATSLEAQAKVLGAVKQEDSVQAFKAISQGTADKPTGSLEEQDKAISASFISTATPEGNAAIAEAQADFDAVNAQIKAVPQSEFNLITREHSVPKNLMDAAKAALATVNAARKAAIKAEKDERTKFVAEKNAYLAVEETNLANQEAAAKMMHTAALIKEGKIAYEPDALNTTQRKRLGKLAHVLSAPDALDALGSTVGLSKTNLKEIDTKVAEQGIPYPKAIREAIQLKIEGMKTADIEAYISNSLQAMQEKIITLNNEYELDLSEAFSEQFGKYIAQADSNHKVNREVMSVLPKGSKLLDSLEGFKGSAIWDAASILTQGNTLDAGALFDQLEALLERVPTEAEIVEAEGIIADFKEFSVRVNANLSEIADSSVKPKYRWAKDNLLTVTGELPHHFLQTAFLAYAEGMAYIGESDYMSRGALKAYASNYQDKIDVAPLVGIGTIIPENVITGAIRRNTYLTEKDDSNQTLPAVEVFLASVVTQALRTAGGVSTKEAVLNDGLGTRVTGYKRNPKHKGFLVQGNLGVLKSIYGSTSLRTNHVGTPPNTDYSHLPEEQRTLAEITEANPSYFNVGLFGSLLEQLANTSRRNLTEVELEKVALTFAVTYMGELSDIQLDALNVNDRAAKEGKRGGIIQEFIDAYHLYQEIMAYDEPANTPIYFSSHFAAQGRQVIEGVVNPQGNKLHRILVRTAFDNPSEVKQYKSFAALKGAYNRTKGMNKVAFKNYVLAMGANLGVDNVVDKQKNTISLDATWVALEALDKELKSLGTKDKPANLTAWVLAQKKAPSVEKLEAVASFIELKRNPLTIEVDGKTNGPFHATWLYGMAYGATESLLNKGGMKFDQEATDTHWDSSDEDLYMEGAAAIQTAFTELVDKLEASTFKPDAEKLAALHFLASQTSTIEVDENTSSIITVTRNLPKGGTTSTVYGGGASAITGGLLYGAKSGQGLLPQFYAQISEVLKSGDARKISTLAGWGIIFGTTFELPDNLISLKSFTLTQEQIDAAHTMTKATLGKAVSTGVNKTMRHTVAGTADITSVTGAMIANYNIALKELSAHVASIRDLGVGEVLSKADVRAIRKALEPITPQIASAVKGQNILTGLDYSRNALLGSKVPVVSAVTKGKLGTDLKPVDSGIAPLEAAGVKATPQGIIGVDALTQNLNAQLEVALSKEFSLNVLDAKDIASSSDVQAKAVILNLAEDMAINTANPMRNVLESAEQVFANLTKPILFEGVPVITNMASLGSTKDGAVNTELLSVIAAMKEEMGYVGDNMPSMLNNPTDPMAVMNAMIAVLRYRVNLGDMMRTKAIAEGNGSSTAGIKLMQMAGVDGTAIIHNTDGTINWDLIKRNLAEAGYTNIKKLDAIASHKMTVDFEAEMVARVKAYRESNITPESLYEAAVAENKLAGSIIKATDKRLGGEFVSNVYDERNLSPSVVDESIALLVQNVAPKKLLNGNLEYLLTKKGIQALTAKAMFKSDMVQVSLLQSLEGLVGTKIILVDTAQADAYGLTPEAPATFKYVKPLIVSHNGKEIAVLQGRSIRDTSRLIKHEMTHASINEPKLRATIASWVENANKKVANTRDGVYVAFDREMEAFKNTVLPADAPASLFNLHYELNLTVEGQSVADTKYRQLQEFAAYLSENPETISAYLAGRAVVQNAKLNSLISKMLTAFSALLKSLIGKGFMLPSIGANNLTRGQLLQAFLIAFADKTRQTNGNSLVETNSAFINTPLYSRVPTGRASVRHSAEDTAELDRLNQYAADITAARTASFVVRDASDANAAVLTETRKTDYLTQREVLRTFAMSQLKPLIAGFSLTASEVLTASNLTAMLQYGMDKKTYQRRHLDKIYEAAKKVIKPADLVPADVVPTDASYAAELKLATALHTNLFKSNDAYRVARFAAISQVAPSLKAALKKVVVKEQTEVGRNIFERTRIAVREAVPLVGNFVAKIPKGSSDAQLKMLVAQLASAKEVHQSKFNKLLKKYEGRINQPIKLGAAKTLEAAKYVVGTIFNNEGIKTASILDTIRDYSPSNDGEVTPAGLVRTTLMEVLPNSDTLSEIDRAVDKGKFSVDGARNQTIRSVEDTLKTVFESSLTEESSKAVLEGEVRGDLASLVQEGFTDVEILELLNDPTKVDGTIKSMTTVLRLIPNLATPANFQAMLNEANSLGYRMVNGGSTKGFQFPNTKVMVRKLGNGQNVRAEAQLSALASLYAIKYMNQATKTDLAKLYSQESLRTDGGNGLVAIRSKMASLKATLVARHGEEVLFQIPKGNVPDVTDASASLKVVPKSMLSNYPTYTKMHSVTLPHSAEPHYVIFDDAGGFIPYVTGGLHLTESTVEESNKGYITTEGFSGKDFYKVPTNTAGASLFNSGMAPEVNTKGGLVPYFNMAGDIAGYRFELPRAEWGKYVAASTDVVEVLATYSGRVDEERSAKNANRNIIQLLKKQYDAAANKNVFVKVSAESTNKQVKTAWAVLPMDGKKAAKEEFGGNFIYVHRDAINSVLGYREKSISNLLRPDNYDEGTLRKAVVLIVNDILGPKVASWVRKIEKAEQELLVAPLKDLVVVKSAIVPASNIISNVNQLSLRGVASEDIFNWGLLGTNAKRDLDAKAKQMYLLREQKSIAVDAATRSALSSEISKLQGDIRANPLYTLVYEEGLNPAVVEELGEEAKRNSVRDGILDKINKKIPQDGMFIDAGKEVIITQDSSTYKALNEALELGDFIAKFILYKHLTENEGESHADAVVSVRAEFINYNRLQNDVLDWLNKTGGTFFMKYALRIQPIIASSIKKNPSRAVAQVISTGLLGMPSPYEAFFLNKNWGASVGIDNLVSMGAGAHPYLN